MKVLSKYKIHQVLDRGAQGCPVHFIYYHFGYVLERLEDCLQDFGKQVYSPLKIMAGVDQASRGQVCCPVKQ